GAGSTHQTAMFGLFFHQRRVDFEQSWRPRGAGVFHSRKTPKRIALINQVERPFGVKQTADLLVCADTLLLAQSQFTFRRRRQRMQSNSPKLDANRVNPPESSGSRRALAWFGFLA